MQLLKARLEEEAYQKMVRNVNFNSTNSWSITDIYTWNLTGYNLFLYKINFFKNKNMWDELTQFMLTRDCIPTYLNYSFL